MDEIPPAQNDPLAQAVEQLYENERLTDNLADEAAGQLLRWGEQQLKILSDTGLEPDRFQQAAHELGQVIRAINRLAGERKNLSEPEFVQRLLDLVSQAAPLPLQPAREEKEESYPEQETTDDEKT